MINTSGIATKSRRSVAASLVSPAIWYKLYEGTGTTLNDTLEYGPALTVAGTTAGIWATRGYLTPFGDNYANSGASAALGEVFRIDNFTDGHILVAFDHQFDGDATNGETFFTYGDVGVATAGGYELNMNGSEQMQFSYRTQAAGSNTAYNISGTSLTGLGSTRLSTLFEMLPDGTCNLYRQGVLLGTASVDFQLVGARAKVSDAGLTLFARRVSGAYDRYMNVAAGTPLIANFFAMKCRTYDATRAIRANREFFRNPGDLPEALRGA